MTLTERGELDSDRPCALWAGDEVETSGVELDVAVAARGELGELLDGVSGEGGEGEEGEDEGAEEHYGKDERVEIPEKARGEVE